MNAKRWSLRQFYEYRTMAFEHALRGIEGRIKSMEGDMAALGDLHEKVQSLYWDVWRCIDTGDKRHLPDKFEALLPPSAARSALSAILAPILNFIQLDSIVRGLIAKRTRLQRDVEAHVRAGYFLPEDAATVIDGVAACVERMKELRRFSKHLTCDAPQRITSILQTLTMTLELVRPFYGFFESHQIASFGLDDPQWLLGGGWSLVKDGKVLNAYAKFDRARESFIAAVAANDPESLEAQLHSAKEEAAQLQAYLDIYVTYRAMFHDFVLTVATLNRQVNAGEIDRATALRLRDDLQRALEQCIIDALRERALPSMTRTLYDMAQVLLSNCRHYALPVSAHEARGLFDAAYTRFWR